MISRPQNDLRHTGHIGYDGAIFGDVGFIGDNYDKLPIKVAAGNICYIFFTNIVVQNFEVIHLCLVLVTLGTLKVIL